MRCFDSGMLDPTTAFNDEDDMYFIDDETAEYMLHPLRSHLTACFRGTVESLTPLLVKLLFFAIFRRFLTVLNKKGNEP